MVRIKRQSLTLDEHFGYHIRKSRALQQRAPIQGNTMRRPYMSSICSSCEWFWRTGDDTFAYLFRAETLFPACSTVSDKYFFFPTS